VSDSPIDDLLIERTGPVWYIRLNRPAKGNALSRNMVAALDMALHEAEQASITALVLRGEGKHFCAGFDLANLGDETDDTLLARFVRIELMLQRLARAPFATLAIGQGKVIGAGADLFAACTYRAMLGKASFAFPGARGFGLVLGTRRLSDLVGAAAALDWTQTGRMVQADEALQCGLATMSLDDEVAIAEWVSTHTQPKRETHAALKEALQPNAASQDARDLELLVRSAAKPGLQQWIADYIQRI
jgi:enoyl-CoA hydratase/carnithine racemase